MNIHELRPAVNSKRSAKRVGRGTGSGSGKTCGRGTKGQNSRSGGGVRPGFEGGQVPLLRRLPRRGFTNPFKKEFAIVNVKDFESFQDGAVIDAQVLLEQKIIGKIAEYGLKVLGNGDLNKKVTVKAAKFTKSAEEKIVKAGGHVEVI
ncbi:MAG: 50S ribosomal protein L15 [Bacilli bacterium]